MSARIHFHISSGASPDVVRLLAPCLSVPQRDVEIVSGHSSRDMTVALSGMSTDEIERRLTEASAA